MKSKREEPNFIEEAVGSCKKAFWLILLFSGAINIMMLVLPIYSMQTLDRVISSGSYETLFMLSLVACAAFIFMSFFSVVRSLALIRIGQWLDNALSNSILELSLRVASIKPGVSSSQGLRDLAVVRTFLTGPTINGLMDVPWSLLFLIVVFMIHWISGLIALVGSIIMLIFAVFNEIAVRNTLDEANEKAVRTMGNAEVAARNAEAVEAMGMMPALLARWKVENDEVVGLQNIAANRSAIVVSMARCVRMLGQVLVMGIGTVLVLNHDLSTGGIIAGSILVARVLSPFENAIGMWTAVEGVRKSYSRLKRLAEAMPDRKDTIKLPPPKGVLQVEKVLFAPLGTTKPIIKGVSFTLAAGDSLGIVGASAAGKSTLAKMLVGIWHPSSGTVRLDGADVSKWDRNDYGKHVGFLPQDVELFPGTVKENIARLLPRVPDEKVIEAAQMAGAHEMILRLPSGYETDIGIQGSALSAGQRQRVGLARAFFGNPRLLVLDEPNSNLDEAGEAALKQALMNAKQRKMTVIIITHRPSILNTVDYIMLMQDGLVADFGKAQEMMKKFSEKSKQAVLQQAERIKQLQNMQGKKVAQNQASVGSKIAEGAISEEKET